jgi:hypothetical protein
MPKAARTKNQKARFIETSFYFETEEQQIRFENVCYKMFGADPLIYGEIESVQFPVPQIGGINYKTVVRGSVTPEQYRTLLRA